MNELNQVLLSDCIYHNKIIQTVVITAILAYMVLITVRYFRHVYKDNSEKREPLVNNGVCAYDKTDSVILISLQAISILAIFIVSMMSKNAWLVSLWGLPTVLRGVVNFFSGLNSSYQHVSSKVSHFTIQGKTSVMIIALYLYSVPYFADRFLGTTIIHNDAVILIILISCSTALCFSALSMFGLLIGEIAEAFYSISNWKKLYDFGLNCHLLQEKTAMPIWKKSRLKFSQLSMSVRVPLYILTYILCLAVNTVLAVLFVVQWIIQLAILAVSYILRFVEFLIHRIYFISDSGFIWLSVRLAIIFAFISTEARIVSAQMVRDNSRTIFEYISEVLLIPLILTEISNIRITINKGN